MASDKPQITIVPPDEISQPPYANQTFTVVLNAIDVNVVFMRLPFLDEESVKALIKAGKSTIPGDVVGSITLPRKVALDMATQILQVLKAPEASEGKEPS